MAIMMDFLIPSSSLSRLALPANGGDKVAQKKATMANEYAVDLSNWSGGQGLQLDPSFAVRQCVLPPQ